MATAARLLSLTVPAVALSAAVLASACGGAGSENAAGAPTCSPAGTELRIQTPTEQTHTFSAECLAAPANEPFTIEYTNEDRSFHGQHNIEIKDGGESLFKGRTIAGNGTTITYQVPALPSGVYEFVCTRHPFMKGTLFVA